MPIAHCGRQGSTHGDLWLLRSASFVIIGNHITSYIYKINKKSAINIATFCHSKKLVTTDYTNADCCEFTSSFYFV